MIRWLMSPKLEGVSKYIECYWYIETASDNSNKRPKLNPDLSAHLILSAPEQSYHYQLENIEFMGNGSHWLYPHCKTFELDHTKFTSCIGIKFKIGALYSLMPDSLMQKLIDTVTEFDINTLSSSSINENELLSIAKNEPEMCIQKLDQLFAPILLNTHEDSHSKITRLVLPILAKKPINELEELVSCSQRTLERSFLKVTGATLKQCQSINKLEGILEYLYQRKKVDIDWVEIAYQFGFSDQPHLIRYLKKQINLTPKKYAEQRGFTIDVYGGVTPK